MEGEILTMFDNIRKKMRQCWLSWNVCNKASTPTTTQLSKEELLLLFIIGENLFDIDESTSSIVIPKYQWYVEKYHSPDNGTVTYLLSGSTDYLRHIKLTITTPYYCHKHEVEKWETSDILSAGCPLLSQDCQQHMWYLVRDVLSEYKAKLNKCNELKRKEVLCKLYSYFTGERYYSNNHLLNELKTKEKE